MTELKPCPFCGYEGIARKPEHCLASDDYYTFVDCTNCDHVSHDGAGDTPEEAAQVAAEAWNARHTRTSAWVSAEDRLPNDLVTVILSAEFKGTLWGCKIGESWSAMNAAGDKLIMSLNCVEFWQPLPAPPVSDG